VRRVIAPMAAGEEWPEDTVPDPDDVQYVIDLGLIRQEGKRLFIANDIYREVIPRELTVITQFNMASRPEQPWYVGADGRLNLPKLLREFQQFFRENSESWLERFDYKEAGFQLLLQAFLQRIVNGGGLIDREYALGSGRVDLLVRWRINPGGGARTEQRFVLELKTIRGKTRDPGRVLSEGLEQTARYAERSNAEEAHLVICDERPGRHWDEKIYERTELHAGREICVWGV
jgi:hypothetical protein